MRRGDDALLELVQGDAGLAELLDPAVQHLVLARRGADRLLAEEVEGAQDLLARLLERPLEPRIGGHRRSAQLGERLLQPLPHRADQVAALPLGEPAVERAAIAQQSGEREAELLQPLDLLGLQQQRLRPQGHERRLDLQDRVSDPRLRHIGELARTHHLDRGA